MKPTDTLAPGDLRVVTVLPSSPGFVVGLWDGHEFRLVSDIYSSEGEAQARLEELEEYVPFYGITVRGSATIYGGPYTDLQQALNAFENAPVLPGSRIGLEWLGPNILIKTEYIPSA